MFLHPAPSSLGAAPGFALGSPPLPDIERQVNSISCHPSDFFGS
jgi:hypothetical protein